MRVSGQIVVLSGLLFVLFLVLYMLGGDRDSGPQDTAAESTSTTVGDRERIRQMLSGEFKREPKKNVALGQGRLRCVVRDGAGAPAPGANVEVTPLVPDAGILAPRPEYRNYWEASVSANGYAEFRALPAGEFLVVASREGAHGVARVQVDESGAFAEAELVLAPSLPRAGIVRDSHGRALAEAVAVPIRAGDWVGDSSPYRFMPVVTDEDGQFTHPLLPSGTWEMLVAAKDHAPTVVQISDDSRAEIQLDAGQALIASVVRADDQRPLSNTKVLLRALDAPGETYSARSTGQGLLSFAQLRPAKYSLTLVSDSFAGETQVDITATEQMPSDEQATPDARNMRVNPLTGTAEVVGEVESGPAPPVETAPLAPLSLAAHPAGSVRGRVLAANADLGVSGVAIAAYAEHAREPVCTTVSDGAGYYHLRPLPEGVYTIIAPRHNQYAYTASAETTIEVPASGTTSGPEFREQRGVTLTGMVMGGGDGPVAEANIEVELMNVPGALLLRGSGPEGTFEISGLAPTDQVQLTAVKLGRRSAPFGPVGVGENGLREILLRLDSE